MSIHFFYGLLPQSGFAGVAGVAPSTVLINYRIYTKPFLASGLNLKFFDLRILPGFHGKIREGKYLRLCNDLVNNTAGSPQHQ